MSKKKRGKVSPKRASIEEEGGKTVGGKRGTILVHSPKDLNDHGNGELKRKKRGPVV